tara:strand:- start:1167 stop:1331 length:165 start_codon:yes stop_codon:yes gene_type:complete
MALPTETIELIKKRYGENSRTYKMVMENQTDESEQLTVTGSMHLRPELDVENSS